MCRIFHEFIWRLHKYSTRISLFQFNFPGWVHYNSRHSSLMYAETSVRLRENINENSKSKFKILNTLSLHGKHKLEKIDGRDEVCQEPQ